MKNAKICVDASLVVKWLVTEEGSDQALKLYKEWDEKNNLLLAPFLIDYEVGSTLRQKIVRSLLRSDDLYPAIDLYKRIEIVRIPFLDMISETLAIADTLAQATLYDACYLLAAKKEEALFVTADERFYKAANPLFPFVQFYKNLI